MSWSTAVGLIAFCAALVVLSEFIRRATERRDEAERKREIGKLTEELKREIETCGNLNRIARLRRRLRELGAH